MYQLLPTQLDHSYGKVLRSLAENERKQFIQEIEFTFSQRIKRIPFVLRVWPHPLNRRNTRHRACRPVYYANPMHYSNDSRLRIARDGCHVYPPFLFRPGAPSACRRRYLRYRSSIPRHRHRFTNVATGPMYRWQLPAIFYAHPVLGTNFACSTNHNVEQPVSRFHSTNKTWSREWHTSAFAKLAISYATI